MNIFKEYRNLRNFTLDDVCDHLKYSKQIIQDLENDKIDFLEKPYNYYCAKTYSEFLGFNISEEEIAKFK